MKNILMIAMLCSVAFVSGCAHKIQMTPNTTQFKESKNKVDSVVGYYISEADRTKAITTPGGGGDKVSYVPYRDTETVLYMVLANKFKDVYRINDLQDKTFLKDNEIELVILPVITTDSSSSSLFTWPPTNFTVDLTVKALDHNGDIVWEKQVAAEGVAESDEFVNDFSLAARRATEKAFLKLAAELDEDQIINKSIGN